MESEMMFRNLDYVLVYESDKWSAYKHLIEPIYIVFSMIEKGYYTFQLMDDNSKKFLGIQIEEHKAIHQFMKDKGWIE